MQATCSAYRFGAVQHSRRPRDHVKLITLRSQSMHCELFLCSARKAASVFWAPWEDTGALLPLSQNQAKLVESSLHGAPICVRICGAHHRN